MDREARRELKQRTRNNHPHLTFINIGTDKWVELTVIKPIKILVPYIYCTKIHRKTVLISKAQIWHSLLLPLGQYGNFFVYFRTIISRLTGIKKDTSERVVLNSIVMRKAKKICMFTWPMMLFRSIIRIMESIRMEIRSIIPLLRNTSLSSIQPKN